MSNALQDMSDDQVLGVLARLYLKYSRDTDAKPEDITNYVQNMKTDLGEAFISLAVEEVDRKLVRSYQKVTHAAFGPVGRMAQVNAEALVAELEGSHEWHDVLEAMENRFHIVSDRKKALRARQYRL